MPYILSCILRRTSILTNSIANKIRSLCQNQIDHGTNQMNPQTAKITKTLLPLASTTHAGRNVIPKTTSSVAPPLIDWDLLATTHASYAAAPFVAISRMISVIIADSPSKIVIQGEEVATTPSPTLLLTRSAQDACSASHVDALCEEEEGALAFKEAVRSFLSFMLWLMSHSYLLTEIFVVPHQTISLIIESDLARSWRSRSESNDITDH